MLRTFYSLPFFFLKFYVHLDLSITNIVSSYFSYSSISGFFLQASLSLGLLPFFFFAFVSKQFSVTKLGKRFYLHVFIFISFILGPMLGLDPGFVLLLILLYFSFLGLFFFGANPRLFSVIFLTKLFSLFFYPLAIPNPSVHNPLFMHRSMSKIKDPRGVNVRYYVDEVGKTKLNALAKGHPSLRRSFCKKEECPLAPCEQPCDTKAKGFIWGHLTRSYPSFFDFEGKNILGAFRLESEKKKERGFGVLYRKKIELEKSEMDDFKKNEDVSEVLNNDIKNKDDLLQMVSESSPRE